MLLAVCLNYWHTAQTPMHTPQDMPQEVFSQSPSPEQTMGGTQYYIAPLTTWNSIPHQVTDASSKIRLKKTDKKHLMEQRDCEATQTLAQTHAYTTRTHTQIHTNTHMHTHYTFKWI